MNAGTPAHVPCGRISACGRIAFSQQNARLAGLRDHGLKVAHDMPTAKKFHPAARKRLPGVVSAMRCRTQPPFLLTAGKVLPPLGERSLNRRAAAAGGFKPPRIVVWSGARGIGPPERNHERKRS
jgi:hypothetical protein